MLTFPEAFSSASFVLYYSSFHVHLLHKSTSKNMNLRVLRSASHLEMGKGELTKGSSVVFFPQWHGSPMALSWDWLQHWCVSGKTKNGKLLFSCHLVWAVDWVFGSRPFLSASLGHNASYLEKLYKPQIFPRACEKLPFVFMWRHKVRGGLIPLKS